MTEHIQLHGVIFLYIIWYYIYQVTKIALICEALCILPVKWYWAVNTSFFHYFAIGFQNRNPKLYVIFAYNWGTVLLCLVISLGPCYLYGLALIPALVNYHMHSKIWDQIDNSFPKFHHTICSEFIYVSLLGLTLIDISKRCH